MVKLVGAALIVAAFSIYGWNRGQNLARRPRILRELQSALGVLITEIVYGATPLPAALKRLSRMSSPEVAPLFEKVVAHLTSGQGLPASEAWRLGLAEYMKEVPLTPNGSEILIALGADLGASDRKNQQRHLELAIAQLKGEESKAEEVCKKQERMWKYLGPLVGLMIALALL